MASVSLLIASVCVCVWGGAALPFLSPEPHTSAVPFPSLRSRADVTS